MDNIECVLKNIEFELERSADNMEKLAESLEYQNKLLQNLINVIREKE
jgi:hypothetical protein